MHVRSVQFGGTQGAPLVPGQSGGDTELRCSVSARLEAPPPPVQILETALLHPSVNAAAGTRPVPLHAFGASVFPSIAVITLCVFEAWLSFLTFSNFP